jgi:UrcA family protein
MRMILIAAAAASLVTGVASAEGADVLVVQGSRIVSGDQRAVPVADLQLATAQGRDELRKRVGFAIADLCDARRFSVAEPTDALKCRAETWAAMQPRLDQLSPRLAAR